MMELDHVDHSTDPNEGSFFVANGLGVNMLGHNLLGGPPRICKDCQVRLTSHIPELENMLVDDACTSIMF